MNPRYEAYFDRWLSGERRERIPRVLRRAQGLSARDVETAVNEGIRAAALPPEISIRPDTVAFLVINLHEMVVLPTAGVEGADESRGLLREVLPGDVTQIVRRAAEYAEMRPDSELTPHSVLRAVTETWSQLQFAQPWRWEGDTGLAL
jgi:hypothetical protein